MRKGQTADIYFIGSLSASLLGFLATIYFARVLGSDILGIYFLATGVVSWLVLGTKMGFMTAVAKRISEKGEKDPYLSAGFLLSISFYLAIAVLVYVLRAPLNDYFGAPIYQFVILMLGADVLNGFVNSVLRGENLVHIKGVQSFLGILLRSVFQVILVYLGFELIGMLVGYVVAFFIVALLGLGLVLRYADRSISVVIPEERHFRSLFDYAKYSWLGRFEARTFSWTDIIVLGLFVPSNLVGIYGVCWNISNFMSLFSKSISQTMFPEISEVSSKKGEQEVVGYLDDSLAYAGFLTIPGLVGAGLIGGEILNIYGEEFSQGSLILVILIFSVLLHTYQKQFLNVLNAINRPELSFRVNGVFVIANIVFNFVLVYLYGWMGAAVATFLASSIGLVLAYRMTSRVLSFTPPVRRLCEQLSAAVLMGVVVYTLPLVYGLLNVSSQGIAPTLVEVGVGGIVYFISLIVLSDDFRNVAYNNISI